MNLCSALCRRRWPRYLLLGVLLSGALIRWQRGPVPAYDAEPAVRAIGTLQPLSSVEVGAQVSGQITRLHVSAGDTVARGQLLAEIDASVLQAAVDAGRAQLAGLRAQLAEQQAQYTLARQQHARQQQMAAAGATREEDLQSAAAVLAAAGARVDRLEAEIEQIGSTLKGDEARLGYARIYAPIAGTVTGIDAKEGQTLNAAYQTPTVLRIADLSRMTGGPMSPRPTSAASRSACRCISPPSAATGAAAPAASAGRGGPVPGAGRRARCAGAELKACAAFR